MPNYIRVTEIPFTTRYDLINIRVVAYSNGITWPRHILEGKNRQIAIEDILSMNKHLDDGSIKAKSIRFTPTNNNYDNSDYSCLWLAPDTKTGKIAKFPLILWFQTLSDDESFRCKSGYHGKIYYLQNGDIGKFEIHHTTKTEITSYKQNFTVKRK